MHERLGSRPEAILPLANRSEIKEVLPERGRLVVVEGIDGAGKTSVIVNLQNTLKDRGMESAIFHNFTEGPLWSSTMLSKRQALDSGHFWPADFDRGLQVAVYLAHVRYELIPLLQQYSVVISDRGALSKIALSRRAYGGRVGFAEMMLKNATDIPMPDLLIFLRVSPEEANRRIEERLKQGGRGRDWRENVTILSEAASRYEELLEEEPFKSYSVVIEANQPLSAVINGASNKLNAWLDSLKDTKDKLLPQ